MNNSKLKVNGQSGFVVVDQAPITLSWSPDFEQVECQISVSQGFIPIYQHDIRSNQCYFCIDELELEANSSYSVKVSVIGEARKCCIFTKTFITGNLGEFSGEWIYNGNDLLVQSDYYKDRRNTVIRKKITLVSDLEEAIIHIVGLGYYHLYVNGKRVSNYELNTDWTNYDKTVFYDTFDICPYLVSGENEIAVELGNGWYNPAPLTLFGKYNLREVLSVGEPKLLADIKLKSDGEWETLGSDSSWEVAEGAFLSNNIYLGESYDFRLRGSSNSTFELNDTQWHSATLTSGPKGKLVPSYIPKIKQVRAVSAKSIQTQDDGVVIIDFGQTIAGFIDLTYEAQRDQVVQLRYGEEIGSDGHVNGDSTLAGFVGKQVAPDFCVPAGEGGPERAEQIDQFICAGGTARFTNSFTFHSFRYVEIKGLKTEQLKLVEAIYVHTCLENNGEFRCSDPYLNKIYELAKVTKQNNVHSVFADCARERLAYGGDIVALATSQLYMFNTDLMYRKTIQDFINDMRDNGGLPETAPFMGIKTNGTCDGAGPLGWQLVVAYLLNVHYKHYGDLQLVKASFPYIEKQIKHLNSLSFDEITQSCLGDWGSILAKREDVKNTSPAIGFTAACFYYYHIKLACKFAQLIDEPSKVQSYAHQLEILKQQIIERYQNDDGSFADRSQTSYIFALYFELTANEDKLLSDLTNMIRANDGQLTSGIFGQSFAYELFAKYGVKQVVAEWLKWKPGFPNMLSDGNNALKEFFGDNHNGSCNHAMFSSYVSWFYQGLGGIQIEDDAQAADKITIRPHFDESISFVDCSYKTVKGIISSNWSRNSDEIELHITTPHNMKKCILVIDIKYVDSVSNLNVIHVDKNDIFIDITDSSSLKLSLKSGVLVE